MHIPVLFEECLQVFKDLSLNYFIDGTFGKGGHALGILKNHPEIKQLIAIEQDFSSYTQAKEENNPDFLTKLKLIHGNFAQIEDHIKKITTSKVEGVLVDLGVSSMQLDQKERGFSFQKLGPLDMRMDQTKSFTAADIVNHFEEKALKELFFKYGEEPQAKKAAFFIVKQRKIKSFETTLELAELLDKHLKLPKYRLQKIHPATRIFQALRIAVNDELKNLEQFLPQAINLLTKGGRLAVITFHSLEDRIVKQAFNYYASDKENTTGINGMFINKKPLVKIITRKPIVASLKEINLNSRSRSAKLRVLEKI